MDTFLKGIGVTLIVTLTVFLVLLLTTLMGMLAGAIVAWVFPQTTALALVWLGVPTAMSFWQFSGMVGFLGGFFRTVVSKT